MSKPSNYGPSFDVEDAFGGFLDVAAKTCLVAGLAAIILSASFLIYYFLTFTGGSALVEGQALSNVGLFSKLIVAGSVASAVGSTYLFWGEETLSAIQLALAGILWFAPFYLPAMGGSGNHNKVGGEAMAALQSGGTVLGLISLIALLAELALRVRVRIQQGSKSDALKYGKGIKEEKDIKNVFMGKCWQLPYCRKFVRERCPIFHAKKTCWKERVGCMCEEEVIRNAMENRPIPKDIVAAAKYIPVNNRITGAQKRERCRQCVIFNEHLKHKYRLALPVTILSFIVLSTLLWTPLMAGASGVMGKLDNVFKQFSLNKDVSITSAIGANLNVFQSIFLVCFLFVTLAYTLKLLEYVIFKLKV